MKKGTVLIAINLLLTSATGLHAQPSQPKTAGSCSLLSDDVQQFAGQLSSANQALFCGSFSDDQRDAAMAIAGQYDSNGNLMTEDLAVQKIAQDYNIAPPTATPKAQTPSPQKSSGGGCPVK